MFHVPCCMLHSVCCIHHTVCSSVPWELASYPHLNVLPQLGVTLRRPWNSLKFQGVSNAPKNHQTGPPRPPKVSKKGPNEVPNIIKFMKKSKMRNLMKTIIFTMFLRGWDINIQHDFHSKIIKNQTCEPNILFDTPNHRKYRKVTPNCLQWGTQNLPKINENPPWGHSECPLVHLCPTWSLKWRQNGVQGPPNRPQMVALGTQIDIKINKVQYL